MLLLASTPVFAGGIVDRVFSGGAKSLAKQAQNLNKKAAELQEKAAGIEEKALALSDRDRRAYQAELERLGFVPPPGLFQDAEALLTGAPEAPEGAGGIAGLIGGIFGGRRSNSGSARSGGAEPTEAELQAALEAAQQILGVGANAPSTTAPPATTSTPAPTQSATPTTAPASGGPSTFTLTGIPSQYNGKYAMLSGVNPNIPPGLRSSMLLGAQTVTMPDGDLNATFTPIRSGSAVFNLYVAASGQLTRFSGGDTLHVEIAIFSQASASFSDSPDEEIVVTFENVSFRNGSASKTWRDGTVEGGTASTPASRSLDTWTRTASTFGTSDIFSIAYGNNRFVAVGQFFDMAYSTDGANWTSIPDIFSTSYVADKINDIAFGNNRFVVVADRDRLSYSADGVSWTRVTGSGFGGSSIYAVAWGNNRWVAGGGDGKMAYSSDSVSWTAVADTTFGTTAIRAIAFGNNRWVAGGDRGKMAYSADGRSWTAVAASTFGSSDIKAVAWGNNRFIAVGGRGQMAYSADGSSWTRVTNTTFGSSDINAIVYANNRWVAVGDDGKIAYSADGVSWTTAGEGILGTWTGSMGSIYGNDINAVAYGNNRFVVGGHDGSVAYADW